MMESNSVIEIQFFQMNGDVQKFEQAIQVLMEKAGIEIVQLMNIDADQHRLDLIDMTYDQIEVIQELSKRKHFYWKKLYLTQNMNL